MVGAVAFLGAGVFAFVYLLKSEAAWTFLRYRGNRLVTCPETKAPAAVKVASAWAAVTAAVGQRRLRLKTCSRWPDRQDCDQPCLWQVRAAPRDTLVATILRRWYEGKRCVACEKLLEKTDWLQHTSGALSPDSETVEWRDVAPEKIPEKLATHVPLCWNCLVVQTFRQKYPELVVERPARPSKER